MCQIEAGRQPQGQCQTAPQQQGPKERVAKRFGSSKVLSDREPRPIRQALSRDEKAVLALQSGRGSIKVEAPPPLLGSQVDQVARDMTAGGINQAVFQCAGPFRARRHRVAGGLQTLGLDLQRDGVDLQGDTVMGLALGRAAGRDPAAGSRAHDCRRQQRGVDEGDPKAGRTPERAKACERHSLLLARCGSASDSPRDRSWREGG